MKLMLTADAGARESEPEAEKDRVYNEHTKKVRELEERSKLADLRRLRPSAEAATVRLRNGNPVAIDGPFLRDQGSDRRLLSD